MRDYIVDAAEIDFGDGNIFKHGEPVSLSDEQASRLFSKGYIRLALQAIKKVIQPDQTFLNPEQETVSITEMNALDAIAKVKATTDSEVLQKLLDEELDNKKRKTVIEAIKEKLNKVDLEEDPEEDPAGNPESLKLELNAEDTFMR